jgi:ribose transport system substrate-binding protein
MTRPVRWTLVGAVLIALVTAVQACGGGDERTSDSDASTAAVVEAAEAELQPLLAGDSYAPPASSGPMPQKGKEIWVLSCLEAAETCSTPAHATVEAAESLGWDATLYDTRSEPARIAEAVRQAIAAGADGLTVWGLDCEQIGPQPLRELDEAEVLVSAGESQDCDPPLFDAVVSYSEGEYEEWFHAFGEAQATALIAATEGRAKVILFDAVDIPSLAFPRDGFTEKLAGCRECEIVKTVGYTISDLGPKLEQRAQQAVAQHPEANAVYVNTDTALVAGVRTALKASRRADEIVVVAAEGQPWTMADLRAGLPVVGVGGAHAWEGYQIVDNLVRLFAGEEPVSSGIGLQVYDAGHNVPSEGNAAFVPPIDWRAAYRKRWGLDE